MKASEDFKLPSGLKNISSRKRNIPTINVTSPGSRFQVPNCKAPTSIQLPGESAQEWARRRVIYGGNLDIERPEREDDTDNTWFLCRIKFPLPDETVSEFRARMKRCGLEEEEEDVPQSPSDLPPPPGASSSNDICASECYNGYNNIVCRDRDSGEEVSRQSTSTRDISCCYNECNDRNTWRIVCNPEFYRDTQTPCYEPQPTKL